MLQLLRYCFKFLFYVADNVAVLMDVTQHPKYYRARRLSYSILALALTFSFVQYVIRLNTSYHKEH